MGHSGSIINPTFILTLLIILKAGLVRLFFILAIFPFNLIIIFF